MIRDLDSVGDIVDDVADAGGDATRIDGIRFTVEDPLPFMADLREAAVNNAKEKAQHYADLIGASLGDLVYLAEAGGVSPPTPVARAELAFAQPVARASSSISGGELTLRLTVQAAFAHRVARAPRPGAGLQRLPAGRNAAISRNPMSLARPA